MITGFGRTGRPWGVAHSGAKPDIMTLGKGFGSGFPIAGVLTRNDIAAGEALVESVGRVVELRRERRSPPRRRCASVATIRDDRLWDNAERVGAAMVVELRRMQERFPFIGDVRGAGLFLGIELVKDRRTKEPVETPVMQQVYRDCVKRGLLAMTYTPHVRLQPASPSTRTPRSRAWACWPRCSRELDRSGRWR